MNKKGFTLVELLAVIAILGIMAIIALPNVLKIFKSSTDEIMKNQETQVSDAAELYVKDYCTRKISDEYICSNNYVSNNYLCLSEIQTAGYIKSITYKGKECEGMVTFDSNGKNPTAYLYCDKQTDGTYAYKTNNTVNIKTNCKAVGSGLTPTYGDVNLDGNVTSKDMNRLLSYIAGTLTLNDQERLNADVNLDGEIDNQDMCIISNYLDGDIGSLPYTGTCEN